MHPLQLRAVKTMETIVIEHYLLRAGRYPTNLVAQDPPT